MKEYLLKHLCVESVYNKELTAINYKSELKSGVRLTPAYFLTDDGLLESTIYYCDKKPVLKVSEEYEYNAADAANPDMPISKRGIHKRTKKWQYYFTDGTLDKSGNVDTFKIKEKYYWTDREGLVVGAKRRFNIQVILSERSGTALVILGVFKDSKEVKEAMRQIEAAHSNEFSGYEKYGTDNIYQSILDDALFDWLNTHVPSKAELDGMVAAGQMQPATAAMLEGAFNAYDLDSLRGMDIRTYFIEKLKGNLK